MDPILGIVIASSLAQAGATYISAKSTSAAGKKRAELEAQQHKTNAELAELQALQQEMDRRDDYGRIAAANKTRSLQSAQASEAEYAGFRTMGRYAWLKPIGIMGEGAYKAAKLS